MKNNFDKLNWYKRKTAKVHLIPRRKLKLTNTKLVYRNLSESPSLLTQRESVYK